MNGLGRLLFLLLGCCVMVGCTRSTAGTASDTMTSTAEEDWVDLLDGGTLDQWEMYGDQDTIIGWQLIDGELHASGAGWDAEQDLVTRADYGNFELALEWKLDSANSSGIFYHVPKDGVHQIYELAPEYQVIDDTGWPSELEPNQLTAGNYAMHAPTGAAPQPVGQWNTTRILVRHPQVEHWLNGTKVVEYEIGSADWQARKASGKWADVAAYATADAGRIGLQNAGKVVYRNISIREL